MTTLYVKNAVMNWGIALAALRELIAKNVIATAVKMVAGNVITATAVKRIFGNITVMIVVAVIYVISVATSMTKNVRIILKYKRK